MIKSEIVLDKLICPETGEKLLYDPVQDKLVSSNGSRYPVVGGIPVVINENKSIFRIKDFTDRKNLFFDISKAGSIKAKIGSYMPEIDHNMAARNSFRTLERLLVDQSTKPRVLILGGSIARGAMKAFLKNDYDFIETDVSFGPRTALIVDAHSIPYEDSSFDCVILQAVLEHVVDPRNCVEEIWRVLKPDGLIYSEIPFMQHVHGGAYDFTRYTHSGQRRLFRNFQKISSGTTAGAATVLAWSIQYLLLAVFGGTKFIETSIRFICRITLFWLKYIDYLIPGSQNRNFNAASGIYFLGKKSDQIFGDNELIRYYSSR